MLLVFAEKAVAAGQVKGSNDPVTLLKVLHLWAHVFNDACRKTRDFESISTAL